jgi:hypothetical protein
MLKAVPANLPTDGRDAFCSHVFEDGSYSHNSERYPLLLLPPTMYPFVPMVNPDERLLPAVGIEAF